MDLRRLRAGEWIAGVSGGGLLGALFLPWYRVADVDVSAFEAFAIYDVLLVAIGGLGVSLVVVTAVQKSAAVGIALDSLVTTLAAIAAIALAVRVLNMPGDLDAAGASRAGFAWVGLAATWGIFAGALVAMRDERLSKPGRPTDSTGVPVDSPPPIDVIRAP